MAKKQLALDEDFFAHTGLGKFMQDGLPKALGRVASGVGSVASQRGKHKIRTSPTSGDWSGMYRSNPRWRGSVRESTGRVESGQMLDDFTFTVDTKGRDDIIVRVGWVHRQQDYYFDQDQGFLWESPNGEVAFYVPGMFALETSQDSLDASTAKLLNEHIERALRSSGR